MRVLTTIALGLMLTAWVGAQSTNSDGKRQQNQADEQQESTFNELEKLQIAVQGICPVSGNELGTMGDPVKIQVGEEVAYLCCNVCKDQKINAEHWAKIQTRIAKAQKNCPIMDKAVDSTMKFTVVNGQKIFVCCPPCIAKIEAEPDAAINKVKESYAVFVAAENQVVSDKLHAKAQGICPVSGQELGSMGDPVKVQVGEEEHAFLCCQGCVGKQLKAEHWKTVQENLAKAQGTCPVMGKAIDASMDSVVVNGRKIFVCCPPCIKKIEADSDAYIQWLNDQIDSGDSDENQQNSSLPLRENRQ